MHPVEFTFYKFLVLLVSALTIGVGITNVVYFNNIRLKGQCEPVNGTTATTLLYLNIIMVLLAVALFLWSLYRLFISGEEIQRPVNANFREFHYNYNGDNFDSGAILSSRNRVDPGLEQTIASEQKYL